MFTAPPALVDAGGVDDAVVVGDQLPLVVAGHPFELALLLLLPVLADDFEDEPQPASPTVIAAPAITATLAETRRTLNTTDLRKLEIVD